MIGKTLSHYKVIEKIGEGGMGEVYRAEDTNLSRDVAIKVLPEQFTKDPQRLARFEREAKLLAQLNHPNIAAIHSFEHADDVHFLVLELVEGETLAERVAKGPLPVEEALEVCRQIAEGVEAAHEKGVIHRDLKPANVKVTPEGKVKILDFGLAKAFEAETPVTDISQSPTLTEEMTRAGVILGTAAYMSPEQARGKPVDKRSDVFAFGCVLYELLTGKRAFEGETITETIAAILKSEPDWGGLPQDTSKGVHKLLQRSLVKDPDRRFRDIEYAKIEIADALAEPTAEAVTDVSVSGHLTTWKRAIPWSIAVVIALIAVVGFWSLTRPIPQPITRFSIAPPPAAELLTVSRGLGTNQIVVSPDGRHIIYAAVSSEGTLQLYMHSTDAFTASPIPGTANPGGFVFFSPDGKSIGFFAGGKLKKTSLAGGSPITLCDAPSGARSGDWFEDTIVFTATFDSGQGLYRVSANGGEPEMLAPVNLDEGELAYLLPDFLPDGKNLLFTIRFNTGFQTALLSLETGERKVVLENARQARYLSTGHLVYEQSQTGNLMAAPFDLAALEVTGDSVPVVQGVGQTPDTYVDYAISNNGTLVYVPGESSGWRLVWVDREGREKSLTEQPRGLIHLRLSPDGKQVAYDVTSGDTRDIWIYDIDRGTHTRLTTEGGTYPVWTPDGMWVTFTNGRNIYRKLADGSRETQEILTRENTRAISWSPDGRILAFEEENPDTGWDIGYITIEGDDAWKPFLVTAFDERSPMISPDGRWLAYISDESGQDEIYVQPFPEGGPKLLISTGGGIEPMWSPDGRELFYRIANQMMAVAVETELRFGAGTPRQLYKGRYSLDSGVGHPRYGVSPDGQQFLMGKASEAAQGQIRVVLNWFEELKRLVPTN